MAERAGMSQSKLSKIETGVIARPAYTDIQRLLDCLRANDRQRRQIDWLFGRRRAYHMEPLTVDYTFDAAYCMEYAAQSICMFSLCIPAIMQSIPWRQAVLELQDIDDSQRRLAMRSMLDRQDLLLAGDRNYHIVLSESALYAYPATLGVHIAQLDRIERVAEAGNVKLGIIPFQAGLLPTDIVNFELCDQRKALSAMLHTEMITSDARECKMYANSFQALAALADYDTAALGLLLNAKRYFVQRQQMDQ